MVKESKASFLMSDCSVTTCNTPKWSFRHRSSINFAMKVSHSIEKFGNFSFLYAS